MPRWQLMGIGALIGLPVSQVLLWGMEVATGADLPLTIDDLFKN
ncbi:MAG: hypothetical protein ACE5F4_00210 [Candidatus Paceibacteria bacterium]